MGLNMPARTVVFTSVRKFDGKDFRWVRTPGTQDPSSCARGGIRSCSAPPGAAVNGPTGDPELLR